MNAENAGRRSKIKRIIFIAAAAISIASLIAATVILHNPRRTETRGEMSAEDIGAVKLIYTPETLQEFNGYVLMYLNKLFKDFEITFDTALGLSELIINGFQNASIGADKLLSFGKYLSGLEVSSLIGNIIIAYCKPSGDSGDLTLEFDPNADVGAILSAYLNPIEAIEGLTQNTTVTAEEFGRICYEIALSVSDGEYHRLLKKLGVQGFSSLFINIYVVYDLIADTRDGGVLSRGEARMIREILYETGVSYKKLLDDFGADNIEYLLGIGNGSPYGQSENLGELLTIIFDELEGLPTILLNISAELMTTLSLEPFNAFADYTGSGDENLLVYAETDIIKTAVAAAKKHVSITDGMAIAGKLSRVFAAVRLMGETESTPDMTLYETYVREYAAECVSLFLNIENFANNYADINSYENFLALGENRITQLKNEIGALQISAEYLTDGGNALLSLTLYNILYYALGGTVQ